MSKTNIIDVLKVIQKEKAKKLVRSDNAQTFFNNRAICLGEAAKEAKKLGVTSEESELKTTYYDMYDKYYHKSSAFKILKVTEKSVAFWRKVAEYKTKSGVSCNTYIKAQFAWFDQTFGTAPGLPSLITDNAVQRAVEYGASQGNIVQSSVPYKAEVASVLRQTDETIRAIMKAQKLTKEEFYKTFVLTNEFPIPKIYLENDPIYKNLVRGK